MKVLVTYGPSYAPIDKVRRITNFSTGKLGVALAQALTEQGHDVYCFKGEGATCANPEHVYSLCSFTTNEDLAQQLRALGQVETIQAVFHAAALCDYEVAQITNTEGEAITGAKIRSNHGDLTLTLKPARKLLPYLRTWFPHAHIVGWKYELEGTREEALAQIWKQIEESHTDAAVLNGEAYGEGFGFCVPPDSVTECPDLPALVSTLPAWLHADSKA